MPKRKKEEAVHKESEFGDETDTRDSYEDEEFHDLNISEEEFEEEEESPETFGAEEEPFEE